MGASFLSEVQPLRTTLCKSVQTGSFEVSPLLRLIVSTVIQFGVRSICTNPKRNTLHSCVTVEVELLDRWPCKTNYLVQIVLSLSCIAL